MWRSAFPIRPENCEQRKGGGRGEPGPSFRVRSAMGPSRGQVRHMSPRLRVFSEVKQLDERPKGSGPLFEVQPLGRRLPSSATPARSSKNNPANPWLISPESDFALVEESRQKDGRAVRGRFAPRQERKEHVNVRSSRLGASTSEA